MYDTLILKFVILPIAIMALSYLCLLVVTFLATAGSLPQIHQQLELKVTHKSPPTPSSKHGQQRCLLQTTQDDATREIFLVRLATERSTTDNDWFKSGL